MVRYGVGRSDGRRQAQAGDLADGGGTRAHRRARVTYKGIDTSRLYVTGLSMGGYGTWDAIYRKPRKFRKAVPICGGFDPTTVTTAVGTSGRWFDIPIWDFHSNGDGTVPVGRSIEMLDAIMAKGGSPLRSSPNTGPATFPKWATSHGSPPT